MIWLLWVGLVFSCHDLVAMGGTCLQLSRFGCYGWDLSLVAKIVSDGNFCIYVEKTAGPSYVGKTSAYSSPVSSVL